MNTESDTPKTDALMPDQGQKRTMFEHVEAMEAHSRQLERELNETMAALRNLTHEIGKHEGASMMHPRLTRAISAAKKITNGKKEQQKIIGT
jgi:seryl-tRNA synthetase